MVYILRDDNGEIVQVSKEITNEVYEPIDADDPELLSFLQGEEAPQPDIIDQLETSDLEMVRVIEDLIEVLIDKNLIKLTDLPAPTQNKLLKRRKIRTKLKEIL